MQLEGGMNADCVLRISHDADGRSILNRRRLRNLYMFGTITLFLWLSWSVFSAVDRVIIEQTHYVTISGLCVQVTTLSGVSLSIVDLDF